MTPPTEVKTLDQQPLAHRRSVFKGLSTKYDLKWSEETSGMLTCDQITE